MRRLYRNNIDNCVANANAFGSEESVVRESDVLEIIESIESKVISLRDRFEGKDKDLVLSDVHAGLLALAEELY